LFFLPKNVLVYAAAGIIIIRLLSRNGSYTSPLHKRCSNEGWWVVDFEKRSD